MNDNDFASISWDREDIVTAPEDKQKPPRVIIRNSIEAEYTLTTKVSNPQKEADTTKDAYISYLSNNPQFKCSITRVRRRFTDFVYLHTCLVRDHPACAIPPLPDKHKMEYITGDRFGHEFTSRRCSSLNSFLVRLTLHPTIRRSKILLLFLESEDWHQYMRAGGVNSRNNSISPEGGVIDGFMVTIMNAFSRIHKQDKQFIDDKARADKLGEDSANVEKMILKIVKKQIDLATDYSDFGVQWAKLVPLEPGLASAITALCRSLEEMSKCTHELRDEIDTTYLTSLKDLSNYVVSLKTLLKQRDQKQLDFESLTEYLNKLVHERDGLANGVTAGGFLRGKVEDLRGVDHEAARKERLRKLELRVKELTVAVESSRMESEAFDEECVKEVAVFEKIKEREMKPALNVLTNGHVEYYKKVIDEWSGAIESLEKLLAENHESEG
ncbi:Sorting nexin-4 [Neolecta irregularis DAH-3]|uniref:Sorting nexin-4 n=1 Tax=Neolecta irregularis (strain DAH-3) TaxID=1198029 RepID=A0A1U7LLF5_NEOID|nr:Sorting nexin-4 [Neolecta irregularis DAH-3]|eukprot:OLL23423.1 Sorting nexin-4 [Neolecta irregularis DAH-3]